MGGNLRDKIRSQVLKAKDDPKRENTLTQTIQEGLEIFSAPGKKFNEGLEKLADNPISGALDMVNGVASLPGAGFGILDLAVRKLGSDAAADIISAPFVGVSVGVDEGIKGIQKGLDVVGYTKEKEDALFESVGVSKETKDEITQSLNETNQIGAQILAGYGMGKGVATPLKKGLGVETLSPLKSRAIEKQGKIDEIRKNELVEENKQQVADLNQKRTELVEKLKEEKQTTLESLSVDELLKKKEELRFEISSDSPKPKAKILRELVDVNKVINEKKNAQEPKLTEEVKPEPIDTKSFEPKFKDDIYDKAIENAKEEQGVKGAVNSALKLVKDTKDGLKDFGKNALVPISSELNNISPVFKNKIRLFEFGLGRNTLKRHNVVEPMFEKIKDMPIEDAVRFDLARKNSDTEMINSISKKYGIENEMGGIRKMLDDLADEAGIEKRLRDYHPRMVKDYKGFVDYFEKSENWNIFNDLIKKKEAKLKRDLTVEEQATLINNALRGYNPGIRLSKTGNMKDRSMNVVTPELDKFYHDSNMSLVKYIDQTTEFIEARRFFGKLDKGDINESIGAYTLSLIKEKKLTLSQAGELEKLLKARFNQVGTSGVVTEVKNIAYVSTLGTPLAAITQIGDLAIPLYRNGIIKTAESLGKAVAGKSEIKLEDLGINSKKIAQEFADQRKRSKIVGKIFDVVGFSKVDALGKETLVNSTLLKYREQAGNPTPEFTRRIESVFGEESPKVINDLKSGKTTDNVKLLLFNELLDTQPIALSEMPKTYLTSANGRVFYMLKTFFIRRLDYYRNETFKLMGDPKTRPEAIKNMIKLTSAIALMEASTDEVKNLILGRETSVNDLVVDNALRFVGFSKFQADMGRREGYLKTAAKSILPPTNFIDDPINDVINMAEGKDKPLKTIQDVPIGGKLYHWWFGKDEKRSKFGSKYFNKYKKDY